MPVPADSAHERADKLEADDKDKKNGSENFAGAPLSQPAFDPNENDASEQDIEYCESEQDEGGPPAARTCTARARPGGYTTLVQGTLHVRLVIVSPGINTAGMPPPAKHFRTKS